MTNAYDRLRLLAEGYEADAAALRRALALIHGTARAAAAKALPGKLDAAAARREATNGHNGNGSGNGRAPEAAGATFKRDHAIEIARQLWHTQPALSITRDIRPALGERQISMTPSGIGFALRGIRARCRGKGTAAVWLAPKSTTTRARASTATRRRASTSSPAANLHEGRRRMLQLLALVSATTPRTAEEIRGALVEHGLSDDQAKAASRGIGSLMRRGYLKRRGDGYLLTKKEYQPKIDEAAGQ